MVHQPRQIDASTADRRNGRRWGGGGGDRRNGQRWSGGGGADRRHGRRRARRHRLYWLPAAVLALALVAGEALRGLA